MWQPGSADGPLPLMTSAARTHPPGARPLVRSDIPSRVCGQRTARPTDQPENSASGLGRLAGQVGTLPDPGHCPEINVVRKIAWARPTVPLRPVLHLRRPLVRFGAEALPGIPAGLGLWRMGGPAAGATGSARAPQSAGAPVPARWCSRGICCLLRCGFVG